jgi:hypothetical protein
VAFIRKKSRETLNKYEPVWWFANARQNASGEVGASSQEEILQLLRRGHERVCEEEEKPVLEQ